jgi:hypothetical protein
MKNLLLKLSIFCTSVVLIIAGCQRADHNRQPLKRILLVPDSVATSIAEHFKPSVFFNENNPTNNAATKSTLTGQNKIKTKYLFNDSYGNPALYIFNFENNAGFIFVSADYQMQPILGYVEHGEFKKDIVPVGIIEWVNTTMENIEIVRNRLYDNSKGAAVAWRNYYNQNGNNNIKLKVAPLINNNCIDDRYSVTTIGPLLPVTWGQGCTYNELCPSLSCNLGCGTGRAWTGCVATATAQVIKYWHPTSGYNYNYASMPVSYGNNEVQRLMKDIGSATNMAYGCSGSGAESNKVPIALKTVFGFNSANYVSYSWQRVLNNLNYHWPVLMDGCRTQTGNWFIINWWNNYSDCHEWVCDGYSEYSVEWCVNGQYSGGCSYLYFHMNWGWHEVGVTNDYNGWFAFDNWNIPSLNKNYQYARNITSEICP